eukprot:g4901.t1
MRVFTMSHVSFASILLCLIMSPGCFCILPVLDGEVNVGLEGVGFDNVFIQDNTLPEVDTTVVPSGLGTGVVDPNLGTDGLNFGFTDDATLNGVGTNLVAPEFGLGDSNPNLGTADLSTGEVVDDGTALVLGGGNELGSLFQTVVGQVQTVLPAPSPSSVPSPAPPVTPVAQSPPAAAAAVPPASPSSSPPAQVPKTMSNSENRVVINTTAHEELINRDSMLNEEHLDLERDPRFETRPHELEAKDIPIDLFHDLRGTPSHRESFYPFSEYNHRIHLHHENQSEHLRQQSSKNRDRILKIAELVANLSKRSALTSVIQDLPLSGTDLEELIYELEFRGRRQIAFVVLEEYGRNRDLKISVQFCENYVRHLFKTQCTTDEFLQFLNLVRSFGVKLSSSCYYTIAMFMIGRNELIYAMEVVREHDEYKSAIEIYNGIVEMCLIDGRPSLGEKIYEQMNRVQEVEPNLQTFTSLMTCAFRCHDDQLLFSYMRELKSRGFEPDLYIYNLLIKASERMNDIWSGLGVYEEMVNEAKVKPNMKTFNALIRLCGRNGMLKESLDFLEELTKTGSKPSLLTFNSLLSSCVKCRQPLKAFELFERMTEIYRLTPNTIVYTSLIRACVQTKDLKRALELLEELKYRGLELDVMLYSALVQVCSACKDVKTGLVLLHEMVSKGINPNEVTKEIFIQACFAKPSISESFKIIEDLGRCGLYVESNVFNILIRACEAVNNTQGAAKWRALMTKERTVHAS